MKNLVFILLFFSFVFADIYEELRDFAYEKKSNKNIKIKEAKVVEFSRKDEKCLELLIQRNHIEILRIFNSCKTLEQDEGFKNFIEKDFFGLYQDSNSTAVENFKKIQNAIQDIMVYYKLRRTLGQNMSRDSNLVAVKEIDHERGGTLVYKIDNQACVRIEFFKKEDRMTMRIGGIENPNEGCKILLNSPKFKELSLEKGEFKLYSLE